MVKTYHRIIISTQLESSSRSGGKRRVSAAKGAGSQSGALVLREWHSIKSNSTFLLQTFLELLIIPLLLAVTSLTGSFGEIKGMLDFIRGSNYIELLVFGVCVIFFLISSESSTGVSREGRNIAVSRVLPVKPEVIAYAKVRFHLTIVFPAFLFYTAAAMLFFRLNPLHLLYMIPGGFLLLLDSSLISLAVDLKRPLLTWSHPQQAMKQNLNVLIAMGANALLLAFFGGAGYLLMRTEISALVIGLLMIPVAAALSPFLLRLTAKAARECYGPQRA